MTIIKLEVGDAVQEVQQGAYSHSKALQKFQVMTGMFTVRPET